MKVFPFLLRNSKVKPQSTQRSSPQRKYKDFFQRSSSFGCWLPTTDFGLLTAVGFRLQTPDFWLWLPAVGFWLYIFPSRHAWSLRSSGAGCFLLPPDCRRHLA